MVDAASLILADLVEAAPEAGVGLPAGGAILDAVEAEAGRPPSRFRVRVIQAGLSGNRNYYPDDALAEAVPLFAGARVIVKPDAEHVAHRGRDPRAVIGRLVDPRFVAGAGADTGSIEAVFEALDPSEPIIVKLREAVARQMQDLFGLSIDARAQISRDAGGVRRVQRFAKVNSVDLIVEPGAGGRVLDVLEAAPAENTQENSMRDMIIARIRAARPQLLEGRDPAQFSDSDLDTLLAEALAPAAQDRAAVTSQTAAGVTPDELSAAVALVEARIDARDRIAACSLPAPARQRVMDLVEARGDFSAAAVDAVIKAEQDYLAPLVQGGRVTGTGPEFARVQVGETRAQKTAAMLEAFFDPAHADHRHAQSFRDIYRAITGDQRVTGLARNCDQALLAEALDSQSFDAVLGDGIHRRLLADYRSQTDLDIYRLLTGTPVPVSDFRMQERTRFGGYGDIPVVAESAAYQPLTSPSDEQAEYAVAKRGGTERLTIEMIKNDDVGAIRRIPVKLSRAAKRTLCKFVLDFLRLNPAIYDGKALFHADHGNLGATALGSASYAAARLAMMKQAEPGSNEPLGIGPKYLWVSPDGEEAADNLFRRSTNLDATFVQSLKPTIVPVFYWTDANDWVATAETADIPLVELGFLDGEEEPLLLVQDNPTSGAMFTNDQITYKLRHIYGATVVDYRGAYKAVVA